LVTEHVRTFGRALSSSVEIREWYVCTRGGDPVGPVSTDLIARGIIAGKVPRSALVARVGDSVWQRALRVPEITTALEVAALAAKIPAPSGVRGILPDPVGTQEAS
jgi:hypothetical protein